VVSDEVGGELSNCDALLQAKRQWKAAPRGAHAKTWRNSDMGDDLNAPKIFEELVRRAEAARASDIHLHMHGGAASVAFRLDGVLTPVEELSADVAERVFGRIKYLARLKTYQESLPQDGRIEKAEVGSHEDIRVATYPTVTGEKIVLRLFSAAEAKNLDELGLAPRVVEELRRFLAGTSGLLLLTGPAGSGKTTTIYACLRQLAAAGGRHIITVEDPVEQVLPGIMQTEVNEARGLDFAKAARHLLRQDPQALVLGEIRDDETANLGVRAALTGHLVISTLHAGSCKGVVERLMVMCADKYAVVSALSLIVNQRLLRKVCANCGGRGCERCLQTGYAGRAAVAEFVSLDEAVRGRLRESGPSVIEPRPTLAEAALQLVAEGKTTQAEFQRLFGQG
jgi:type II secretory ATPase GspE/PulE/Tfp pilus assembly ATPase PilB-like protein